MEVQKKEPADKPGSVADNHSSGIAVTSILKRPTRRHRGPRYRLPIWSCSRWGFPCRILLPDARCALTAPFHPYPLPRRDGRYIFCCTFRRLAPPRCYLAPCPVEPGLSSFPPVAETRLPGRLSGILSIKMGRGKRKRPKLNLEYSTVIPKFAQQMSGTFQCWHSAN